MNYNRKALEEFSLPGPYRLYLENNWTWDSFKQLLIDWCNADAEHMYNLTKNRVVSISEAKY
ncbi:MAG: hypothetical protein ACI4WS_12460 [Oscillospiraceae bacterium]